MWPFASANSDSVRASRSRSSLVSRTDQGSTAKTGCELTDGSEVGGRAWRWLILHVCRSRVRVPREFLVSLGARAARPRRCFVQRSAASCDTRLDLGRVLFQQLLQLRGPLRVLRL